MSDHPAMLFIGAIALIGLAVYMLISGEGYMGARVGFHSRGHQKVGAPFVLMLASGLIMLALAAILRGVQKISLRGEDRKWSRIDLLLSWGGLGFIVLGASLQALASA